MKQVAYIFTRESTAELLEENIITPLMNEQHGAKVIAMFFVGDGVYHLVKGARIAKNIKSMISTEQVDVYACAISIKNRELQNILIDGVTTGSLKDFYDATSNADHIISF